MDKLPRRSFLSVEEKLLRKQRKNEQEEEDLETRQWWNAKFQSELSSWEEIHTPLKQKKGLTKKPPKIDIRSYYEQELLKLQESVRVTSRNYKSAKIEIKVLREHVHDFDENEKKACSLKKLDKKSHVCVHCSDLFKEICNLESDMGITKEVEAVKFTSGEALTHDQNEAILKQYVCTLRQLMGIFPKPEEVDELQAEVASLTQKVVLLKKQFRENTPDAAAKLLEQKSLDICDLKNIIVKLQTEKEIVDNDIKEAILALNRKKNKVVELTDSLAQLTHDEKKLKSDVFEQEKLRGEVKRLAGQEVDSLNRMIMQILSLTKHIQKQIRQLKTTASVDYVEKLSDIYITTNQLKETEKAFKNNLVLKMSVKDAGNKKIEAFAVKVSHLNQYHTKLEQDLIKHLAGYIESTKLKTNHALELLEVLQDLAKENIHLLHEYTVKSQEYLQMEFDKEDEILQLQEELHKPTLGQKLPDKNKSQIMKEKDEKIRLLQQHIALVTDEMIEARNKIVFRDEELSSLLTYGDFRLTEAKDVSKSAKKALPEAGKPVPEASEPVLAAKKSIPEARKLSPEAEKPKAKKSILGAKSKIKNPIDIDEEIRQVNESIAMKNAELAKLRKDFRTNLKKSVSSLPENPTRKTNTPRAAAAANMNQKVATAANKNQIPGAATNQKR